MSRQIAFEAIGTTWSLHVRDSLGASDWEGLLRRIDSRIQAFDKAYSRFRTDSLVSDLARTAGSRELPPDGYKLLSFYERLYRATGGAVTPLIGTTLDEAGYDARYSLQPGQLHRPPRWEEVISYDKHGLSLKQPALLDFGAAGKGYLVDIVAGLLDDFGLVSFTINAGGDILNRSQTEESLAVGLENPLDTTEALGIAHLGNRSLCASAGSKRQWGEFHHIIDPRSLQSPRDILAAWVIADDTMTADGLATALFFTPPQKLQRHFSFTYALLTPDMALHYAPDFPATVFTAEAARHE